MKRREVVQTGGQIHVREHPGSKAEQTKRSKANAPNAAVEDKLDYIIALIEAIHQRLDA